MLASSVRCTHERFRYVLEFACSPSVSCPALAHGNFLSHLRDCIPFHLISYMMSCVERFHIADTLCASPSLRVYEVCVRMTRDYYLPTIMRIFSALTQYQATDQFYSFAQQDPSHDCIQKVIDVFYKPGK